MRLFLERGFSGFVLRTRAYTHFESNYPLLETLGFRILDSVDDAVAALSRFSSGVVVSGGAFDPAGEIYPYPGVDAAQLQAFERLVMKLRDSGTVCLAVRFSNGDTFFTDPAGAKLFSRLADFVDCLFVDNTAIARYIQIHCPDLANRTPVIAPFEVPLLRETSSAQHGITNRYLHIGRVLATEGPKTQAPVDYLPPVVRRAEIRLKVKALSSGRLRTDVAIAGRSSSPEVMTRDRRWLARGFSRHAGGIGHFYDCLTADYPAEDAYMGYARRERRRSPHEHYDLPRVYRLTNTSNKVITYLMMALPSVVPNDTDSAFYRLLIENEMAIPVGGDGRVPEISPGALTQIRRNIVEKRRWFTFDATCDRVERELALVESG